MFGSKANFVPASARPAVARPPYWRNRLRVVMPLYLRGVGYSGLPSYDRREPLMPPWPRALTRINAGLHPRRPTRPGQRVESADVWGFVRTNRPKIQTAPTVRRNAL